MPRQAPHDARRRHIAEAVLRITASQGLEAVSLRDVATEAGVSMGMVQHYFTSKDQMLLFACSYTRERVNQRITERLTTSVDPPTPRAALRAVCIEILPLDEERRAITRIWIAFLARAIVEPELAAFMRETWASTHQFIVRQIRLAQERGEIADTCDPERQAIALFALVDGLVSHVLIGHYPPEAALAVLDRHLEGLFHTTSVR